MIRRNKMLNSLACTCFWNLLLEDIPFAFVLLPHPFLRFRRDYKVASDMISNMLNYQNLRPLKFSSTFLSQKLSPRQSPDYLNFELPDSRDFRLSSQPANNNLYQRQLTASQIKITDRRQPG